MDRRQKRFSSSDCSHNSHFSHCVIRFYFVGDEDLLEIIGNSKNVPRLQKHFKKMFAGVAAIVLDEEDTQVTGISSKEGEPRTGILCLCALDLNIVV